MAKVNFKDTVVGTFVVIVSFCLVCSVVVSSAVVALDPFKAAAVANDRQVNILKVSGVKDNGKIADIFKEHIVAHLVDVDTGDLIDDDKAVADGIVSSKNAIEGYNFASLAKKDGTSVKINKEDDAAGILTHSKYMPVYFAKDGGKTVRIILPFYGQALWSTVYGYVAVSPEDGNTILGVTFYSHGETPGLGGEIDNPNFQKKWVGKKIQIDGNYAFKICKNAKDNQIDALSGATLTSNGVDNTAKYWFDVGYKPFLEKISKGEISVNE